MGDELGDRDLLGHELRGRLDVALRPLDELLLQLPAADREDRGTDRGEWRGSGCAAQQTEPAVARFDQLHRSLQGQPGGWTVVDANEDAVEHSGLPPARCLLSALTSLPLWLAR